MYYRRFFSERDAQASLYPPQICNCSLALTAYDSDKQCLALLSRALAICSLLNNLPNTAFEDCQCLIRTAACSLTQKPIFKILYLSNSEAPRALRHANKPADSQPTRNPTTTHVPMQRQAPTDSPALQLATWQFSSRKHTSTTPVAGKKRL